MESAVQVSPTANLLRPQQVVEVNAEKQRLEGSLRDPEVKDKGAVRRQLGKLNRQLETQVPKSLEGTELDKAIGESAELLDKIQDGMLTQEEMRKNPSGAVGAHIRWERSNKSRIARWKHLQLRIHAGTDDPDVANLERHRPVTRSNSLNMDTRQIAGKQFFFPQGEISVRNVMSDEDKLALNKSTNETLAAAGSKLQLDEPVLSAPKKKKQRKVTVPAAPQE